MEVFFDEKEFNDVIVERKKVRTSLIVLACSYLIISLLMVFTYLQIPYGDKKGVGVQVVTIVVTIFYILLFYITYGIKYKRASKYYHMLKDLKEVPKTETVAIVKGYSEVLETRDGVDQKAIEISVYSERRQDWFSRGVYVLYDAKFPKLEIGSKVKFYTVANNLYGYEVVDAGNKE